MTKAKNNRALRRSGSMQLRGSFKIAQAILPVDHGKNRQDGLSYSEDHLSVREAAFPKQQASPSLCGLCAVA